MTTLTAKTEQATIDAIEEAIDRGWSWSEIAASFNSAGVSTSRGRAWTAGAVRLAAETWIGRTVVVSPEVAEWIVEMHDAGVRPDAIAKGLDLDDESDANGGRWTPHRVKRFLAEQGLMSLKDPKPRGEKHGARCRCGRLATTRFRGRLLCSRCLLTESRDRDAEQLAAHKVYLTSLKSCDMRTW